MKIILLTSAIFLMTTTTNANSLYNIQLKPNEYMICVKTESDGSENKTESDGSENKTESDGSENKTESDGSENKTICTAFVKT